MRILILSLLVAAAALPAGDPEGFGLWTSAELKGAGKRLKPKMSPKPKVAAESLAKWSNHSMMVAYREGDGEAEWHEKQTDIFIAQTGEATLVYGGKMTDARTTGPGEMRGPSISGGMQKKLVPGDVVHIPAKVPHQLLVQKEFTYAVFKVDQ
jgi:mannose-6-phosphate isomerase-like protein (cupin superfamily)